LAGDGKADIRVFIPLRCRGLLAARLTSAQRLSDSAALVQAFGQAGDQPIPNALVP
jgi:hypothetical protein